MLLGAHEVDACLRHAPHVRDLVVLASATGCGAPASRPARVLADRAPPLRSPSTSFGSSPRYRRQHRQLIGGADRVLKVGGLAVDPDFARPQHVREALAVSPAGRAEDFADRRAGQFVTARAGCVTSRSEEPNDCHRPQRTVGTTLRRDVRRRSVPILVLRHGQSEWNSVRRWQGTADSPLTELGREQAARDGRAAGRAAARVRRRSGRATCGARRRPPTIIARTLGLGEPIVDARLREAHAGEWEGLTPERDRAALAGLARGAPSARHVRAVLGGRRPRRRGARRRRRRRRRTRSARGARRRPLRRRALVDPPSRRDRRADPEPRRCLVHRLSHRRRDPTSCSVTCSIRPAWSSPGSTHPGRTPARRPMRPTHSAPPSADWRAGALLQPPRHEVGVVELRGRRRDERVERAERRASSRTPSPRSRMSFVHRRQPVGPPIAHAAQRDREVDDHDRADRAHPAPGRHAVDVVADEQLADRAVRPAQPVADTRSGRC